MNVQVDVNDERFEALYSSHLFNLDPTNPKFLKTKGMDAFLLEKRRRMEKKKKMETVGLHLDFYQQNEVYTGLKKNCSFLEYCRRTTRKEEKRFGSVVPREIRKK